MCEKGGRRFFLTFPSHTAHRDPTLLTNPKYTGDVFPSRTTKHLEGCTEQSTSKDAHNKTSRRMRTKAPRRMHFVEHREGQIKSPKQTRLQRFTTGPAQVFCHAASRTSKAESLPAHQYHSAIRIPHHGNIYKQNLKCPKQIPTS